MFQAKEEELTLKFEKIKNVRDELEAFKEEHGIKLRYVKPSGTTSFMVRTNSTAHQSKDYILQNKQKFKPTATKQPSVDRSRINESQTLNKDLKELER